MKYQASVLALTNIMVSLTQPAWSMEGAWDDNFSEVKQENSGEKTRSPKRKQPEKSAHESSAKPLLLKKVKREIDLELHESHPAPTPQEVDPKARNLYDKGVNYLLNGELQNAFHCINEAAEKGYAEAKYKLYQCYARGRGVEQDMWLATHWLEEAANQGHPKAQFDLGMGYIGPAEFLPQDLGKALKLLKQSATEVQESSIVVAKMGPDIPETEEGKKKLLAEGLWNYAQCLREGRGIEKNLDEADTVSTLAAQLGHPHAQYALGEFYRGLEDYRKSMDWYKRAAQQDHPLSNYRLGLFYSRGGRDAGGTIVDQNSIEALKFFQKAAGGRHRYSKLIVKKMGRNVPAVQEQATAVLKKGLFKLGCRLHTGLNIAKNLHDAQQFYILASYLDHPDAEGNLSEIFSSPAPSRPIVHQVPQPMGIPSQPVNTGEVISTHNEAQTCAAWNAAQFAYIKSRGSTPQGQASTLPPPPAYSPEYGYEPKYAYAPQYGYAPEYGYAPAIPAFCNKGVPPAIQAGYALSHHIPQGQTSTFQPALPNEAETRASLSRQLAYIKSRQTPRGQTSTFPPAPNRGTRSQGLSSSVPLENILRRHWATPQEPGIGGQNQSTNYEPGLMHHFKIEQPFESQNERQERLLLEKRMANAILLLAIEAEKKGKFRHALDFYQMAEARGDKDAKSRASSLEKLLSGTKNAISAVSKEQRNLDYTVYGNSIYALALDAERTHNDLPLAHEFYKLADELGHN